MSLVEQPKRQLSIRDHLHSEAFRLQLERTLPKHMTTERVVSVGLNALKRSPKLEACSQVSFFECFQKLSQWGLEADGYHAHLIPFGTECQLVIDYKGIARLAYQSGFVKGIHADVVREGDLFEYSLGRVKEHTPWAFRRDRDKPKEAGKTIAAYVVIILKDGAEKHEAMPIEDLHKVRNSSQGYKASIKYNKPNPWIEHEDEMCKKTVFRRASKWIPLSSEIIDAFEHDNADYQPPKPERVSMGADEIAGLLEIGEEVVATPA